MTYLEIFLSAGSVTAATAGIIYVLHIARTSGRGRPIDPARVNAMIKTAPLHRLDRVLDK